MTDGIINVYKERGFTSHDVVAKLRGILRQKKIGHTGTLDPEAEGVLPVCLGSATKVCELLTDKEKTYRAVLLLGVTTDTQDTTGTVLGKHRLSVSSRPSGIALHPLSVSRIRYRHVFCFKSNGKKLYELARQGHRGERRARRITIRRIEICKIDLPRITMEVACSKGYVYQDPLP
ncbi:MAG: tRNA pseudouridine(55) synthase TruB [Lachnospiraceae bacterium]